MQPESIITIESITPSPEHGGSVVEFSGFGALYPSNPALQGLITLIDSLESQSNGMFFIEKSSTDSQTLGGIVNQYLLVPDNINVTIGGLKSLFLQHGLSLSLDTEYPDGTSIKDCCNSSATRHTR